MGLIFAVAAGGALGAVGRYGVHWATSQWLETDFPWATLIVNVLGSFLMGVLLAVFTHWGSPSNEVKAFLVVGVLGAFTTFSTFSYDVITLFERGAITEMSFYLFGSVFCSVMALFAGIVLIRNFIL